MVPVAHDLNDFTPAKRRLFFQLAVALVLIGLFFTALAIANGNLHTNATSPGYAVLGIAIGLLTRRKYYVAAIRVFCWTPLALMTYQCTQVDGLRTPVAMAMTIFPFCAAWLLGRKDALLIGAGVILAACWLTYASTQGLTPALTRSYTMYLFVLISAVAVCLIIGIGVAESYRERFDELRQTLGELQQQNLALEASQRVFNDMFTLPPHPIAVSSLNEGTLLDVNAAWLDTFGWQREEVLGKRTTDIHYWADPSSRQKWRDQLASHGFVPPLEVAFRRKDGQVRHCLATSTLIQRGGENCALVMLLDLTDRITAENELKELNATLELRIDARSKQLQHAQTELMNAERMSALGRMVASVSHELNTPLGNALLAGSTLKENGHALRQSFAQGSIRKNALVSFLDSTEKSTELLMRSIERAAQLVQSFKQVSSDQMSDQRRKFDLAQTIEQSLDALRPQYKNTPWIFESSVPKGLQMDGYPGAIEQIVFNLANNAVLHGFENRPSGTVRFMAQPSPADRTASTLELTIEDNGRGIPSADLGRIFDPFFTTRLGRGGTGIGLSIVHRLVTLNLGGSIAVQSQPDEGTRFLLTLPTVAPVVGNADNHHRP